MAAVRPQPRAGGVLPVLPPVFALVELGVFAAVAVAEFLWEPFPDLTKINPHPYWLPVLLISLQYGTLSGLLTASIAIVATVLIGLPEQDIGEAYFSYLIRTWAQPVLWLVVALLLGAFRMRQIEQRDDLLNQVDDLEHQSRLLDDHAGELQARCDRLERELVTKARPQSERLLDLLALCANGSASTADIDAALAAALPDVEASLYVRAGNGLQLVHAHRWPDAVKRPRVISGLDALALTVIGANRPLSILVAADEKALRGHGLLAVPIVDETGAVGMLKIERMPPSAITPDTVNRLAILAAHFTRVVTTLGAGAAVGSATRADTSSARVVSIPRLVRRPVAALARPARPAVKEGAG